MCSWPRNIKGITGIYQEKNYANSNFSAHSINVFSSGRS